MRPVVHDSRLSLFFLSCQSVSSAACVPTLVRPPPTPHHPSAIICRANCDRAPCESSFFLRKKELVLGRSATLRHGND